MTDLVDEPPRFGEGQPTLGAAVVWEAAALRAEQRQRWTQADHARLRWALCLHSMGRCEQAVTVLRQVPDASSGGRRDGFVVATILCMRLLKWCGRQDQSGAVWLALETTTTSAVRRPGAHRVAEPGERRSEQSRRSRARRGVWLSPRWGS